MSSLTTDLHSAVIAEVENSSFSMSLVKKYFQKFDLYINSNLEVFNFSFYDIVEFLFKYSKKLLIKNQTFQLSLMINNDLTYNAFFNNESKQVNIDQDSVLRYILHIFQCSKLKI